MTKVTVMEKDPVCGMSVDSTKSKPTHQYGGSLYFFCGERCRGRFAADPDAFLSPVAGARPPPKAAPPGSEFVCPMHPEIVSSSPSSCPICGMALEPRTAAIGDEQNPELVDMSRRFWWSAPPSIALLAIGMSDLLPGEPVQSFAGAWLPWIELALATPVVVWAGAPFFERGLRSVKSLRLNMFT